MWRVRVGSFAIASVLASAAGCGARARVDGPDYAPSASAATGGANAAGSQAVTSAGGSTPPVGGAGAGSGLAGAEADSDLSNSCPQAPSNRACPAIELDIRFTRDPVPQETEVWVEALQIPDYRQGFPENLPEVEPSKWDRSPLPAGACVLRIHGLSGSCLRPGAFSVGSCASLAEPGASRVLPTAYYETNSCREGIAPGCPSAVVPDWRNGNWWYFVARGDDTDLVVCAPQCGTSFNAEKQGCLHLAGSD